ncbi:DUF1003 domain-containing protein [Dictyobacter kobayashii]|uniref:Cyclic nucleotide-binding protein n=1 Tax=Dictyobacter kobayashii TaxID=2014872 RepID=A0A402AU78_9CHLR|nr:DUF1003 domain-containing protein [Dictyobacter kobayashii]GCE22625.1 hypothetical protein KDK_64250 [Dictyobacter kobayashii]
MDIISKTDGGNTTIEKHKQIINTPFPRLDATQWHFPKFAHKHSPIINVNEAQSENLTRGAKIADAVAATVGSWPFIIIQSIILLAWIILNVVGWIKAWDPYPFILLNLALSFQAAYAAPFVMMSQNRQAQKDRLTAENDYLTDCKGEAELRNVMEHLDHQDHMIIELLQHIETQHERIEALHQIIIQRMEQMPSEVVKTTLTDIEQIQQAAPDQQQ